MDVSISTNVAASTAKRLVRAPVADPQAAPGTTAKKSIDAPPAEESTPGTPTDDGARTSPRASSLTPIRDTVSFRSDQPDDASAGFSASGSPAVADGDAAPVAPAPDPREAPVPQAAPDVAEDPTGTITVGAKTLDLTTVDYLPTDAPATRATKLQAAIAAVFGAATPGAVSPGATTPGAAVAGTEGPATADLLAAVQDLFASELGIRDWDLAAERVTTTRERILAEAGAAIDAQTGDLPEAVLQLLR